MKGICFFKNKWKVTHQSTHLGYYENLDEAIKIKKQAIKDMSKFCDKCGKFLRKKGIDLCGTCKPSMPDLFDFPKAMKLFKTGSLHKEALIMQSRPIRKPDNG